MIRMEGKTKNIPRTIDSIIWEGRMSRWSSRQIADAVRSHVVAVLVARYKETEPCFLDRGGGYC